MSVAVGKVKVTVAPAGVGAVSVMLETAPMVGGVVSCTVTVNEAVAVFGGTARSEAVNVTVVVPIANMVFGAANVVTGRTPCTMSVAVGGVNTTMAPPGPVASATMLAGMLVNAGAVWSVIVTVKLAVDWLLAASRAVTVTSWADRERRAGILRVGDDRRGVTASVAVAAA